MTSVQLDAIADVVRGATGIRHEGSQHHALRAALARAWPGVPHAEVVRRALDPVAGPGTVAALVDEVTVKETSFMRDRRQLASIDWQALHARARAEGSGDVRVWCAACATGEEPYSLAMLACEAFASTTPPVTILATDVSGAALHAAAAARYRERAVHHVDDALRERYLERFDDHFAVALPLRGLISFAPHNLVSDPYPPAGEQAFDLILCRNVLIYFDPATCVRVVTGLEAALRPGGRLVLGAADALCVLDRAAGVLRRGAGRPARSPSPGHRRPRPVRPAAARPAPDRAREDAMSPDLHYLQGLGELESGDPAAAVASLRRVLYLDPANELAAFALGRAHEKAGDPRAACRRYEQALRMLGERPEPGERVAGPIDASTVAGACEARLRALTGGTTGGWR